MTVGRPTKYTPKLVEAARFYAEQFNELGDEFPSAGGLALHLGISRSIIYDWAKEESKAEFSDILERIQCKQENILLNKGITGEFNSNITKLVLGKHGYSERKEHELTGKDGGPIETADVSTTADFMKEELEALAKRNAADSEPSD